MKQARCWLLMAAADAVATGCLCAAEEAGCKPPATAPASRRPRHLPAGGAGGDIGDLDAPAPRRAIRRRHRRPPAGGDTGAPADRHRRRHLRDRSLGLSEAGGHHRRSPNKNVSADVYAVQQIYALRRGRFELMPYWSFSLNDQFVSHPGPGLGVNYYLTNVLAVGVNGTFYQPFNGDSDFNFQNRRATRLAVPLNEYQAADTVNFTYVPMYGKFAGFSQFIFHYDGYIVGGVGASPHAPHRGHRPRQPEVRLRLAPRLLARLRPSHLPEPLVRGHRRDPRLHLHRAAREHERRRRRRRQQRDPRHVVRRKAPHQ